MVFLHLKDHGTYLEIIIKMDNSWIPCWPSVVTVVAQRLSPARELPHVAGAAPPPKNGWFHLGNSDSVCLTGVQEMHFNKLLGVHPCMVSP